MGGLVEPQSFLIMKKGYKQVNEKDFERNPKNVGMSAWQ